ncbi:unnamed protein product [Durusdinium trenchii]|uniref:Phytanoyl-CoA dioxygenase n=1 Tax=Durusdinium trenchii TaxID=1381693 RepID=A0ABP0QZ44_9DINO
MGSGQRTARPRKPLSHRTLALDDGVTSWNETLWPVQLHEARRFRVDTEREAFLQHLEEEGYAVAWSTSREGQVVADVLSEQDIGHARSLLWDFLEALPQTRVRRDDVKSWGCKRDWLPDERNGILNGFGFGQSDFMWFLRLRPKVKDAFAAVWSTNDLLVSFDGGNVFRPWRFDPAWRTLGGWYHCDQNTRLGAASRGRCCVQGLVTLSEASRNSGGLVVVPQSHRDHAEVCERSSLAESCGDFVPISVNDPILEKGPVLVAAKAGDLILWDSRTVHCNTPGWAPEAAAAARRVPLESGRGVAWPGWANRNMRTGEKLPPQGTDMSSVHLPIPDKSQLLASQNSSLLGYPQQDLEGDSQFASGTVGGMPALQKHSGEIVLWLVVAQPVRITLEIFPRTMSLRLLTVYNEIVNHGVGAEYIVLLCQAEGMPFTQCAQMEEWQLLREVGYVCMTPAAWASDETLEQRRKAFEEGISTSHWPHK